MPLNLIFSFSDSYFFAHRGMEFSRASTLNGACDNALDNALLADQIENDDGKDGQD